MARASVAAAIVGRRKREQSIARNKETSNSSYSECYGELKFVEKCENYNLGGTTMQVCSSRPVCIEPSDATFMSLMAFLFVMFAIFLGCVYMMMPKRF